MIASQGPRRFVGSHSDLASNGLRSRRTLDNTAARAADNFEHERAFKRCKGQAT